MFPDELLYLRFMETLDSSRFSFASHSFCCYKNGNPRNGLQTYWCKSNVSAPTETKTHSPGRKRCSSKFCWFSRMRRPPAARAHRGVGKANKFFCFFPADDRGHRKGIAGRTRPPGFWNFIFSCCRLSTNIIFSQLRLGKMKFHHCRPPWKNPSATPWKNPQYLPPPREQSLPTPMQRTVFVACQKRLHCSQVFGTVCEMIEDSWDDDSEARLSAASVEGRLDGLCRKLALLPDWDVPKLDDIITNAILVVSPTIDTELQVRALL